MTRYAMVVDIERCTGCFSCAVACKAENAVPLGVWRNWLKIVEKGTYPNVNRSWMLLMCNNCQNAVCVRVCPTQATYRRDDGIVMVDPHRCIGCKYCIAACPYEVRYLNPLKRIVQKCQWCNHRVDMGIEPACVNACPTDALIFGDLDDPSSEVRKILDSRSYQVLKPDQGTEPQVYYLGADMAVMRAMGLSEMDREASENRKTGSHSSFERHAVKVNKI